MHTCDGQTDRRTDRILIARPRLHSMERGKKAFNASELKCIEQDAQLSQRDRAAGCVSFGKK